jgi:hypothetical protein
MTRGRSWHNEPFPVRMLEFLGRRRTSKAQRSSTYWPDLICDVVWVPVKICEWLAMGLWHMMRWTMLIATALILSAVIFTWTLVPWLESALGITVLVCFIIATWMLWSDDWRKL